ncbi:MAG: hypothetical protein ACP5JR_06935 [Thermoplasmata archaeon]
MPNSKNKGLSLLLSFLLAVMGIHYLGTTTYNYLDMEKTSISFDVNPLGVFFKENGKNDAYVKVLLTIDNSASRNSVTLYTSISNTLWCEDLLLTGYYSYNNSIEPGMVVVGSCTFVLNDTNTSQMFKDAVMNNTVLSLKITLSALINQFSKMLYVNKIVEVVIFED